MSFIIGVALSAVLIVITVMRGANPALLLDYKALLFVVGGTVGSILITFPFSDLRKEMATIAKLLAPQQHPQKLITRISELAQLARKEGVLSLDGKSKSVDDAILSKGLNLISVSADHEIIRNILEKESDFIGRQEKSAQDFFERLSVLTPGIGMVGTLLEIVQMLYRYTDPKKLAPEIAASLLPVVYGALLSYLILMPLASRLKVGANRRKMLRELAIEGVLALQAGEPPYIVEERLGVYTRAADRKKL
ncbi:MAG TPA: MotA/TolQ/ExbB proton channel family protein [Clostridia bacterium]|nr:MotA/TolQ/ExbB proton channel family protein [Clostridia bacterium]